MTSRLFLAAFALLAFGACDSGDTIDPPTPADVAGVYDFAEFRFVPRAAALQPVSVIDTLIAADSFIELLDGGQATLRFRRNGGTTRLVPGDVEVRRREVRVTFAAGNDVALGRLVLPQVLTFTRDGDALTLSTERTANLEAYDSDRYGGFTAVDGTLNLRLTPRASP